MPSPEPARRRAALLARIDRLTLFGRRWPVVLGVSLAAFALASVAWVILEDDSAPGPTVWQVSIDNQCADGRIAELFASGFLQDLAALDDDGVAALSLCDTRSFAVPRVQMGQTLATTYPGCLSFDPVANTLSMRVNPNAICQRDDVLFCLGTRDAATELPAPRDLVARSELPRCAEDLGQEG